MVDAKTPSAADLERLRIPRRDEARAAAPKRRNRWIGPLVFLLLLGGAGYFFRDRLAGVAAEARAIPVKTGTAVLSRPGAELELTNATGYVVARTKAALSAKLAGRLIDLRVDAGSRVRKGDLIAKLEDDLYTAALQDATAALEGAKAEALAAEVRVKVAERDIAKAKLDATEMSRVVRMQELQLAEAERRLKVQEELLARGAGTPDATAEARHRREAEAAALERQRASVAAAEGAVAQSEAEKRGAEARVPVAAEAVKRAEASVATARTNLADTEIRAPFDAVVLKKEADLGEMVVPGLLGGGTTRGSVVTLADFSTLEMEVDVFERDLRFVREGAPARITLDAYPESPYAGRVRQIQPTADRQKATVVVKVSFDALDGRVLPEMGGRATFLKDAPTSAPAAEVLAPASARVTVDGRSGVFVLVGDRVRFQAVEFGETRRNGVQAKSGLRGGEIVVVEPPAGLAEGAPVKREK
jgi:RND family efflux transporter MFP subunit